MAGKKILARFSWLRLKGFPHLLARQHFYWDPRGEKRTEGPRRRDREGEGRGRRRALIKANQAGNRQMWHRDERAPIKKGKRRRALWHIGLRGRERREIYMWIALFLILLSLFLSFFSSPYFLGLLGQEKLGPHTHTHWLSFSEHASHRFG